MSVAATLGYMLAAALFAALAGWRMVRARAGAANALLVVALAATALWALVGATEGPLALVTRVAGSGRNFAWLGFMLTLLLAARTERATRSSLVAVHATLAAVLLGQIAIDLLPTLLHLGPRAGAACAFAALLLRMVMLTGALVLVHNLYTAAARDARPVIRLPMAALAIVWTYDLNCYAAAWLLDGWPVALFAARGWVTAATAPLFAVALWRHAGVRMRLSRTATFRSLSLLAIMLYLSLLLVVARTTQVLGGDGGSLAVATLGLAVLAGAALMVPPRVRAWTRETLAKHLFQHRYDYRAEWLRFTDTLGRGDAGEAIDLRAVKALADIVEAPGGLLLLPDEGGALVPGAAWSWPALDVPQRAAEPTLARHLEATQRILELDAYRTAPGSAETALLPDWLLADASAWIAVPLVHFGRLAGVALLARPALDRPLDWEDRDLLRAAGRQVASYLAEARGQAALAEAARFEEFNRRFAFIVHDIKNVASQLGLVARNAARHADNPAFRADMVATLGESVARMNDLLARLGNHGAPPRADAPRAVVLHSLATSLADTHRRQHAIRVEGEADIAARADPARLEQALGHLVQNAIEASPASLPVRIRVTRAGEEAAVEVIDGGAGMSPAFLRTGLFQPFASTKAGGFGIGAFEARAIVTAMAGRLEVESVEGLGTRFRVVLPAAPSTPALADARTLRSA